MSATAVSVPPANLRFWQTTIGKKAVMAVTGVILFGFVVAHLLGNLQIYISAEKLNAYSAALHSMPALLWGARITLLVSVFLHIWASWKLVLLQRAARPIAYIKKVNVELKKDRIRVLTVCPGYVQTAFSENAVRGNELKKVRPASVRGVTAERVARATLRGYLKQKREVIVPWTMHVPVKMYQLFPALVEWSMGKMAK